MEVPIDSSSWLNMVDLLSSGEFVFWESTDYPEFPLDVSDTYIQVTLQYANRIDLLAFDTYGDSGYFWAILIANNLDYPSQVYEGMLLRLPAKDKIDSFLITKT